MRKGLSFLRLDDATSPFLHKFTSIAARFHSVYFSFVAFFSFSFLLFFSPSSFEFSSFFYPSLFPFVFLFVLFLSFSSMIIDRPYSLFSNFWRERERKQMRSKWTDAIESEKMLIEDPLYSFTCSCPSLRNFFHSFTLSLLLSLSLHLHLTQ